MRTRVKIIRNRILLITAAILFIVIALVIIGLLKDIHKQTVQGQIETTDYRVSSKVPSRVEKFLVSEGQYVHSGDTLALLSAPEVNAMENQAIASRDVSKAVSDLATDGSRKEVISSSYDVWQQAIAKKDIASKTYQRINNLYQEGVMSAQRKDEALAAFQAASAAVNAAHSQYQMAVNGARKEEKQAASAGVRKAQADIDKVKALVGETVLTASADGYVTEIFPEVGEVVGTGAPIMNIATNDAWFTFNVREDCLPGISIGNKIKVYLPASNETIPARVTLIKNVGNFASWKATRSLEDIDLKVFEVQARPMAIMKTPHAGMSVIIVN